MATIEARPTEYHGVQYRSKCEAMFARWIECDCQFKECAGFAYEPWQFALPDGYCPDFVHWFVESESVGIPLMHHHIIEYKPARPTETYIAEFADRSAAVYELATGYSMGHLSFGIFYGNPYQSECGIVQIDPVTREYRHIDRRWVDEHRAEMIDCRFDLLDPS